MNCKFCNDDTIITAVCYIPLGDGNGTDIPMNFCPACGANLSEQEPLTLDELREMDGEPVWCVEGKQWGLVVNNAEDYERPIFRILLHDWTSFTEHYLKTRVPKGMFYRHPPKE